MPAEPAADQPRSPSERTSGLRAVLSLAWAYRLAQQAIGADGFRATVVREVILAAPADRVLDIGCGTADILDHLPQSVGYVGLDPNGRYIAAAVDRYGDRGRFVEASAASFPRAVAERPTIVLALGVLHHLDADAVHDLLRLAVDVLEPGGRFVSVDPAITDGQHPVARFLARRDRGGHVRTPAHLRRIVASHFSSPQLSVRHDLLRVPYTHAIVQATRSSEERGERQPDARTPDAMS